MKKKKNLFLIIILVIAAVGSLQTYNYLTAEEVPTETVKEAKVKQDDLTIDFLADGVVTMDTYNLTFQNSGILSNIPVNLGDYVTAGTIVATMDTRELDLKKEQALYDLEAAKAKLNEAATSLSNSLSIEYENLRVLREGLEEAESTLGTMNTYAILYTTTDLANQQAKIDDLKSKITLEQLKISGITSDDTSTDTTTIDNLTINLELIDMDIEQMSLTSPISGTVADINGQVGSSMGTSTTMMVIQDSDHPYILASVSEMDIHQVYVDQKVRVEYESDYGIPYEGLVSHISSLPSIDNNGIVTYDVTIDLVTYPDTMRPGLTTMLNFVLKERIDALIIPNTAVKLDGTTQYVEVATETGSERRDIMTGLTDGVNVEVLSGLEAGEVLLIRSLN